MGTFAKTLFPALRVGYLIVPEGLVDAFAASIRITVHGPPAVVQAALADFMNEGHYGARVRRMRALYADRRACLLAALDHHLGGALAPWLRLAPGRRWPADRCLPA